MDIIAAINDLKTEKDNLKTRIVEIDKQLAEIRTMLPRTRGSKAVIKGLEKQRRAKTPKPVVEQKEVA